MGTAISGFIIVLLISLAAGIVLAAISVKGALSGRSAGRTVLLSVISWLLIVIPLRFMLSPLICIVVAAVLAAVFGVCIGKAGRK